MERHPPGPLEPEKRGPTVQGSPQPQAAEVESAQLLANDSRDELHARGFTDDEIDSLADQFVAEDRGTTKEAFIEWAVGQRKSR
jgi:hypothetical protein